jgi:hypothetical protein
VTGVALVVGNHGSAVSSPAGGPGVILELLGAGVEAKGSESFLGLWRSYCEDCQGWSCSGEAVPRWSRASVRRSKARAAEQGLWR